MTIERGSYLLLQIGQGDSPETFVSIGAQSTGRIGMNANRIQTSNKTTKGWNTSIGGLRDFVLNADGFSDWPDTHGLDRLLAQAIAGNDFNARAIYNSLADRFDATVQATGLELSGDANGAGQWTTTWELSQGAPEQVASP